MIGYQLRKCRRKVHDDSYEYKKEYSNPADENAILPEN
jgi:hypothetical protein